MRTGAGSAGPRRHPLLHGLPDPRRRHAYPPPQGPDPVAVDAALPGPVPEGARGLVDTSPQVVKPRLQAGESGAKEPKGGPAEGPRWQVGRRGLAAVDGGGARRRVSHGRQMEAPEAGRYPSCVRRLWKYYTTTSM